MKFGVSDYLDLDPCFVIFTSIELSREGTPRTIIFLVKEQISLLSTKRDLKSDGVELWVQTQCNTLQV